MKAISLLIWFLIVAAPSPGDPSHEAPPSSRERLKSAIERALSQNPDLQAMESRIHASRSRVPQASAFPDPEVEVGLKDVPVVNPSLTRSDFTMEMVTARQGIPGLGKRGIRKASAEAAAENLAAQHGEQAVDLVADVASSFFALAELDHRIEILERSHDRLKNASASASERYRVGKGTQSDVLHSNLELTAIEDRLLQVHSERHAEAARFNALQNLPANTPVAPIGEIKMIQPVKSVVDIGAQAERASPALAAARAAVRRAEEELELARLERRPDWMVTAYYARREQFEDLAGASVSLNLPFAHPRRLDERRAEMEAELSAAKADLESARNDLRRNVELAAADLERNVEQEKLYRTSILPQAEISYRAAQEAYAVGNVDFETLVHAALDLDTYESQLAMRVSGIGRAVASLQRASGLPLIDGTPETGVNHVEK